MTDAEYAALRAKLLAGVEWWKARLNLWNWNLKLAWERDQFRVPDDFSPESARALAYTLSDWQYNECTITFNMAGLLGEDDAMLEYILVHEMMHMAVNEMRALRGPSDSPGEMAYRLQHEERVCTVLARGFINLRKEGASDPFPWVAGKEEVKHG